MTGAPHLDLTRAAYDTVAAGYAGALRGELANKPLDRAVLAAFAELVQAGGGGPVADIGCGPGRVTAHLAGLGLDAFGIDLSPGMVAVARREHPGLRFAEGNMSALELAGGELGGLVAWYSIIHTPPAELPVTFAEFCRVLRPGGHLLLAFQAGNERVDVRQGYGHDGLSLHAYRLPPEEIAAMLARSGLAVQARILREPAGREQTQHAYLLGCRPAADTPAAVSTPI